jgi:hypothetical protein
MKWKPSLPRKTRRANSITSNHPHWLAFFLGGPARNAAMSSSVRPGIPENFRARIFEKFSQADASTTRTGRGSTFWVELPLAVSATVAESVMTC